jgi:predicted DNA-binding transcriptional regulator AlpA
MDSNPRPAAQGRLPMARVPDRLPRESAPAVADSGSSQPQARRAGTAMAAQDRRATDRLITIADIRTLFRLGRTAAYELTRRPGFPAPVPVSRRCLRWWAGEVDAYADTLQREGTRHSARPTAKQRMPHPATPPRQITGTVRAARSRKEAS